MHFLDDMRESVVFCQRLKLLLIQVCLGSGDYVSGSCKYALLLIFSVLCYRINRRETMMPHGIS